MIGAFTAFGVDVELSVVAVLAYRAFAFWLPTLPGARRLPPAAAHGAALGRRAGGHAARRIRTGVMICWIEQAILCEVNETSASRT